MARPEQRAANLVASTVIEGLLDNEDVNGPGTFVGRDVQHAIELYADETCLQAAGLEPRQVKWDEVAAAVSEMLRIASAPVGAVLVNIDAHKVFAHARSSEEARNEIDAIAGSPMVWELVHWE